MQGGLLRMAKPTQLLRLLDNGGIRRDRVLLGVLQIRADLEDQRRDMVQQAFGWKDIAGIHRQKMQQPLEPACGKSAMLRTHTLRNKAAEMRADHEMGCWGNVAHVGATPEYTRSCTSVCGPRRRCLRSAQLPNRDALNLISEWMKELSPARRGGDTTGQGRLIR
jgi:hypothetical protein